MRKTAEYYQEFSLRAENQSLSYVVGEILVRKQRSPAGHEINDPNSGFVW